RYDASQLGHVSYAFEVVYAADRDDDGHGVGLQAQTQLVVDLEEVGAGAVHLVDEGQAGHAVLVGLAPHGFGLRLHAAHGAIHHAGAVEHAHGTFDFDGEVDVARGVDDVDAVLVVLVLHPAPEGRGGRRRDGDAAFLFLLHPVHGGRAFMGFR